RSGFDRRLDHKSRMSREAPVRIREGLGVKLPRATRHNEVKLLGRIDSPFRPQDRTDIARFYAATSPVNVFNPGARQVSAARGRPLWENARIFARRAMAIGAAQIAVSDTKSYYNFWRPVPAIRAGAPDGNPLPAPDPGWPPLIAPPPHPSYASGHATSS